MRYKREQFYVKWGVNKHPMVLALKAAAIPWGDCVFRPTIVTGVGTHVSTTAVTCVIAENLPRHLSLMHADRRQGEKVAANITTGSLWHRNGKQGERIFLRLRRCSISLCGGTDRGLKCPCRHVLEDRTHAGESSSSGYFSSEYVRKLFEASVSNMVGIIGSKHGKMTHLCMRPSDASGTTIF